MAQLYVWRPSRMPLEPAAARFRAVLDARRSLMERTFRRAYQTRFARIGDVLVGQIATDEGILGWNPWWMCASHGVAWSGVCEAWMGRKPEPAHVVEVARDLVGGSNRVSDWQGTFAALGWDRRAEEMVLVTGATQAPSMWWTEGPEGWAAGNRALPILELVGREPRLDLDEASLFLGFTYHAGDGSFLEGVHRLRTRARVTFPRNGSPVLGTSITMAEYLTRGHGRLLSFDEAVGRSAEALERRVADQVRASARPLLCLTGGRDSRAIAAALARVGYDGPAFTGGAPDSTDVVLGSRVAESLAFEHGHAARGATDLELFSTEMARVRNWSSMNEGIETVRHLLHFPHYFGDDEPPEMEQQFVGMQFGLNRLRIANAADSLADRVEGRIFRRAYAVDATRALQRRFERETAEAGGTPDMWKELYALEVPGLRWGQDNHSAKEGLAWWWTPLVDAEVIRCSWHLPRDRKFTDDFVEAVTLELAPSLCGIEYDKNPKPKRKTRRGAMRMRLSRFATRTGIGLGGQTDRPYHPIWDPFLFERPARVWDRLIDERYVRKVLCRNPNAAVLWAIATLELFAESLESAPAPAIERSAPGNELRHEAVA